MSELLELHPGQKNPKILQIIVDSLRLGAVMAYPTDSGYALGCSLRQKDALARIREIRHLGTAHPFTIICRDIAEVAYYTKVSNSVFRMLKRLTPGGYTFILEATRSVPDVALSKRDTIGVRIPDHPTPLVVAEALQEAFVSTTLIMPGEETPLLYVDDVIDQVGNQVDLVIEGGYAGFEPTSVIDLTNAEPLILRRGSGDVSEFE